MDQLTLFVNGKRHIIDASSQTPLLWLLRDSLGLTGTKFGCGMAQCGACTVLMDGKAVLSCQTLGRDAEGHHIVTIEGLSAEGEHPLQKAWVREEVPQCGYCQSGQIMTAAALLATKPHPSDAEIDEAMRGVICRCGTYNRIRKAIRVASGGRP